MYRELRSSDRCMRAGALVGLSLLAGLIVSVDARAAEAPAAAAVVPVMVDNAKLIRLPEKTTTVVVGNPAIADVSLQKNGVLILTGKSFGTTNLIALDTSGAMIAESLIRVEAPQASTVTVQRGLERESYSCTPNCQPSAQLGDSTKWFTDVSQRIDRRGQQASGAAAPLNAGGGQNQAAAPPGVGLP